MRDFCNNPKATVLHSEEEPLQQLGSAAAIRDRCNNRKTTEMILGCSTNQQAAAIKRGYSIN